MKILALITFSLLAAGVNASAASVCASPGMGMTRYTTQPRVNPCENKGTALTYQISESAMFICEDSENMGGYYMATGSGGFGKTKEGDRKTPTGKYSLGKARPSTEFGIFIPVGYPNASDKKKGYTGGAVGIHGPKRFLACAGALNLAFNWTAGCLAMASDSQVQEIADWVQKNPKASIYIE